MTDPTSFVLLIAAGLLLRTMLHLSRVNPGFDTEHILTMDIPAGTILPTDQKTRNRYLAILADVRALPGVQSAAVVFRSSRDIQAAQVMTL